MRTFFFLLLLAGLAMGFGYPVLVDRLGARDLGTFHLYDSIAGYRPVEVPLKSADGPVGVAVEVRTVGQPPLSGEGAVLTLVVDRGGRSVLAEPLDFSGVVPREANPQTAERLYRDQAGVIADVEDAAYRFTLGPGDVEGVTVEFGRLAPERRHHGARPARAAGRLRVGGGGVHRLRAGASARPHAGQSQLGAEPAALGPRRLGLEQFQRKCERFRVRNCSKQESRSFPRFEETRK